MPRRFMALFGNDSIWVDRLKTNEWFFLIGAGVTRPEPTSLKVQSPTEAPWPLGKASIYRVPMSVGLTAVRKFGTECTFFTNPRRMARLLDFRVHLFKLIRRGLHIRLYVSSS